MNNKYKLRNSPLEVKKMNRPILTMLAVAAVLLVNIQYADAEPLVLEGVYGNNEIFLSIDENDSNIIVLNTPDKDVFVFDSIVNYPSVGEFTMTNDMHNLKLEATPLMDESGYRIQVTINGETERFVGKILSDAEEQTVIENDCKFTANIDKSVRQMGEDIQVFGFVHPDCDTHDLWDSYKVRVKVVDMNGKLVQDDWIPEARLLVDESDRPSLYEFDAIIQEVGVRLQEDRNTGKNYHVYPNNYYVSIPQLNSIHFELGVVYQVQVSYGDMVVSHNFIIIE